MTPETAFSEFQTSVNADPDRLADARLRRDAFIEAVESEDDVAEAIAIGSLRRRTQKAPLNDVDILVVFKADEHPGWGGDADPGSAFPAITETKDRVKKLLGPDGTHVKLLNPDGGNDLNVRRADRKRHSVKCFLDNAGEADSFTVDAVPGVRDPSGGVWIPERDLDNDNGGSWIRSDPERLINITEARQKSWDLWIPTVRLLKYWNSSVNAGMSSLYVEVLAQSVLSTYETRPRAIDQFFQACAYQITEGLSDPAGHCGPIQPDLGVEHARECAAEAAKLSWDAVTAEARGDDDDAVCAWRALFGDDFPAPPSGCDGSAAKVAAAAAGVAPFQIKKSPRVVRDSPQG